MNLFNVIKTVLFKPKTIWNTVNENNQEFSKTLTKYVIPITIIAMVSAFLDNIIDKGLINSFFGWKYSLVSGTIDVSKYAVAIVGGVFLSAFLLDVFAGVFGYEKNFNKHFTLASFAFTPIAVGTVVLIIPFVGWLYYFISFYPILLMLFATLERNKLSAEISQGKKTGFLIISMAVIPVVFWSLWCVVGVFDLISFL